MQNATPIPTIAVTDLDEAKRFYSNTVGLEEAEGVPEQHQVFFRCGNGYICLHERPEAPRSPATVCSFEVENVQETVTQLRDSGVRFEEYDIPEMGIKTENGIARHGDVEAAWFTDPWGNILSVSNTLTKLDLVAPPAM